MNLDPAVLRGALVDMGLPSILISKLSKREFIREIKAKVALKEQFSLKKPTYIPVCRAYLINVARGEQLQGYCRGCAGRNRDCDDYRPIPMIIS